VTFHTKHKEKGFTLIETLVGTAIFLVVALSAYNAFSVLMDAVLASRAKVAATLVANERVEIIRNMPYADVGIVGGIPVGKISRTQVVVRDNYSFGVQTTIRSVDDPFDGTIGGNPPDTSPADYKLVDLDITCSNCKLFTPLKFVTLVAPHALETASANGALFIQVFDSGGIPVAGASVHIVNTQTNPDTIIDETTDNAGFVKIVDAPPGTNAYNITVTKTGYSQDQTYPGGGAAGPNPIKIDSTLVAQVVTQITFAIDKVGSLTTTTVNAACAPLPSIGFSLTGTKLIGTPAVLKYPAKNFTTDATGNFAIQNLEWDAYSALLTSVTFDLAGSTPFPNFSINPNENKTLKLVAVPHVNGALLVSVKDSSGTAIDSASVELQKAGFDQTKTTNSGTCPTPGQVFWNGLANGPYTLTVSKTGFQTSVTAINVPTSWMNQNVTLTP
jgi:prepilin-type N-terminal cleavage/methylation domain-containing protein